MVDKIGINITYDLIREKKKYITINPEVLERNIADKTFNFQSRSDEKIIVNEVITNLPKDLQEIVYLRYYLDLTYLQVAKILDIPVGTVKSKHYRTLQLIKKKLNIKKVPLEHCKKSGTGTEGGQDTL